MQICIPPKDRIKWLKELIKWWYLRLKNQFQFDISHNIRVVSLFILNPLPLLLNKWDTFWMNPSPITFINYMQMRPKTFCIVVLTLDRACFFIENYRGSEWGSGRSPSSLCVVGPDA